MPPPSNMSEMDRNEPIVPSGYGFNKRLTICSQYAIVLEPETE